MADETNRNVNEQPQAQDMGELLRIRRDKLKVLQDEGRDPFTITRFDVTHHTQDIKDNFDAMEGQAVSVAGRLMSKRGMGKVSFCDLQDKTGRIQIYARKDEMDEDNYNHFKKYDIGDIVGVKGEVFRTQRGEMSVRAHDITLLSKSLRPLPEKFHGLTDKEIRYRQRYVDLIMNRRASGTSRSAASSWRSCAAIWTGWALWRWRRPSSAPSPAVPTPGPLSPTTTRRISICICVSPPSCT